MRHFSGEFKGVRPLMADELDRISGGDGEDTDDATTLDTIVVKANGDEITDDLGAFGLEFWRREPGNHG